MMKGIYESAETLIYDPVAANRNATRASLHSLGFRKVELAPSIEALTKHLRQAAPDLLLTEVSGSDVDIFPLIQSVRQGELGENPFTVIIATTWRRDGTLVTKALNSGADDLVARPISTATLGDRIRIHIDRRKGFVVTSSYIGPDRRRDASRPGVECVQVPNSLKVRTLEGLPDDEADRRIAHAIERGKKTMNAQKVRRDAVQLCIQWRLLEQRSQATTDFVDNLSRLEKIAREIKRRLSKTDDMAASDLCMAIESSVAMIVHMQSGAGANGEALDFRPILHRLGMAALGLGRIFAPAETDPASLAERVTLASRNQVQAA